MDLKSVRRVSFAGHRLPERRNGTRPVTTQPPADRTRRVKADTASEERNPDKNDPVQQDRLWKELVWNEKRGVREWERSWDILRNYDQLGQLKPEKPLPSYVSLFSNRVPNTTNQMFGSRLCTPLGSELVRMNRLVLWSGCHRKRKQDPEMMPW